MIHTQLPCRIRSRSVVKALGLSVVLLLNNNFNGVAQNLPPLPGDGGNPQPPKEPTPEELEAQRQAQEEFWRSNLQRFEPYFLESDEEYELELQKQESIRRLRLLTEAQERYIRSAEEQAQAEALARDIGVKLLNDGYRDGTFVKFVGDQLGVVKPLGLISAKTIRSDSIWPGGGLNLDLTGKGVTIGMWDFTQVRTSHVEFAGATGIRVTHVDPGMAAPNNHSTLVAGAAIAGGISNNAVGIAYEAELRASDLDADSTEVEMDANGVGLKLSSHTYGLTSGWETINSGTFRWWGREGEYEDFKYGLYDYTASEFDRIVYESGYILPIWAAGNERILTGPPPSITEHLHFGSGSELFDDNHIHSQSWDSLQLYATAKNILTVGSIGPLPNGYQGATSVVVSAFSSWGPTDDGRIKPDLVVNGESVLLPDDTGDTKYSEGSGTSYAAPAAAGLVAQLYQRFYQTHRTNKQMRASTLKAILIHSADETGDAPGPDYKHGWGLANAQTAVGILDSNATNLLVGFSPASDPHIREVQVFNGGPTQIDFYPTGTEPVKVTIVWSDPKGTNDSPFVVDSPNLRLVNDINLEVQQSANIWYPWILDPANPGNAATNGINFRDNVEQVVINSPTTNLHKVYLTHSGGIHDAAVNGNLTNQWVSVVITGNVTIPKPQPVITDFARTGPTNAAIMWNALSGLDYRVQYIDEVTANNWQDEGGPYTAASTNAAATLPFSEVNPNRFYRVITDN